MQKYILYILIHYLFYFSRHKIINTRRTSLQSEDAKQDTALMRRNDQDMSPNERKHSGTEKEKLPGPVPRKKNHTSASRVALGSSVR